MDCLGLPGETPMMAPPPKVCPVRPVSVPEPVPELPVADCDPEVVLPLAALGSVVPLGAFGSVEATVPAGAEPLVEVGGQPAVGELEPKLLLLEPKLLLLEPELLFEPKLFDDE